jgi:hypothetical protein
MTVVEPDAVLPPGRTVGSRGHWKILDGWSEADGTWSANSVVAQFFSALQTGASQASAAGFAKTTYASVKTWRDRGTMFDRGDEVDRTELPLDERVYVDFARRMNVVLGTKEVRLAGIVYDACRDDPRLALEVLGRQFPWWRDAKQLDLGPPEVLSQDKMAELLTARPQLAIAAEQYALELEAAAGVSPDADEED